MYLVFPLLFILLSGASPTSRAVDDDHEFTVVALSSLKPEAVCSGHRVEPPHNRTWTPLSLQRGPCSTPADAAASPPLVDLLRRDQLRVDDIHMRLFGSVGGSQASGIDQSVASKEYTDSHGEPASDFNAGNQQRAPPPPASAQLAATGGREALPGVVQRLVLDTASDVPWMQCVPCPVPPCHPQTNTFYDPTKSSSYVAFPCSSPACVRLGPYANGCVNGQCQYRVTYRDGSSTSGTYSSDLLTIDAAHSISGFQFGCSHAALGNFDSQTAGIMALGRGPESLVSQTAAGYGNAFSYCLPPKASYTGFFVLGVPHVAASRYAVTPMLRENPGSSFYRVLLQAIAVGGQQLGVPVTVFAAGSVLDTRTLFTRLPPTAYQALRQAFRNRMTMYRQAPPKGAFDTCYDFTGVASIKLPRVALLFDRNAAVELDPSGILYDDCLAFVPNSDDRMAGVLGNVQQRTIEVFYNVGGGDVGFRRGAC